MMLEKVEICLDVSMMLEKIESLKHNEQLY